MDKISVKVLRDVANNPSIIEIIKNNRKITATFDPNTGLILEGPAGQLPSVAEILQMAYPFEIPSFARPAWYDRDSVSRAAEYENTLGPHAATIRLSYICPEDRKAMIESIFMGNLRITAAVTAAWMGISWLITPLNGSQITLFSLNWVDNTVGYRLEQSLGTGITLFPGDKIEASSIDQSTGGTVYHRITYKLTEFDA